MIKETKTANKKSFKKYLIILAFLSLIILITVYCKEKLISKLKFFDKKYENLSTAEELVQSPNIDNLAEQIEKNNDHSSTKSLAEQVPEVITSEQNKIELNNQQLNIVKNDKYITDAYLNYLKNVNHIIVNLFLDKPYADYLNQLNINLPETFALLVENLREYNEHYLITPPPLRRQIFPLHWPIIQKFIKIDKNSADILAKAAKKAEIIKKLDFWLDYCYTEDFKTKFNKQKD